MKIEITTDYIKLDQLLKFSGEAASGTDAKYYITEGMVKLNGEVELRRGKKIYKGDTVTIGGIFSKREVDIYVC